jgi:hypothetical protein
MGSLGNAPAVARNREHQEKGPARMYQQVQAQCLGQYLQSMMSSTQNCHINNSADAYMRSRVSI